MAEVRLSHARVAWVNLGSAWVAGVRWPNRKPTERENAIGHLPPDYPILIQLTCGKVAKTVKRNRKISYGNQTTVNH